MPPNSVENSQLIVNTLAKKEGFKKGKILLTLIKTTNVIRTIISTLLTQFPRYFQQIFDRF